MAFTLKLSRHYLLGRSFKIFADHKSLKYLFTQIDLNMRQRQWIEHIKDYDYAIKYCACKGNIGVILFTDQVSSTLEGIFREQSSILHEFWKN